MAILFIIRWSFVRGNCSPVTGKFHHKDQWRRALMFSLICAWTTVWINNTVAGDLRRYRAHDDVTVMCMTVSLNLNSSKTPPCPSSMCNLGQCWPAYKTVWVALAQVLQDVFCEFKVWSMLHLQVSCCMLSDQCYYEISLSSDLSTLESYSFICYSQLPTLIALHFI